MRSLAPAPKQAVTAFSFPTHCDVLTGTLVRAGTLLAHRSGALGYSQQHPYMSPYPARLALTGSGRRWAHFSPSEASMTDPAALPNGCTALGTDLFVVAAQAVIKDPARGASSMTADHRIIVESLCVSCQNLALATAIFWQLRTGLQEPPKDISHILASLSACIIK